MAIPWRGEQTSYIRVLGIGVRHQSEAHATARNLRGGVQVYVCLFRFL